MALCQQWHGVSRFLGINSATDRTLSYNTVDENSKILKKRKKRHGHDCDSQKNKKHSPDHNQQAYTMPTEQENYKLMWSIICQQMTGGQLKGIDWKKTAADIGIESAEAANKRWVRLKAELIKDGLDPPDAST